MKNSANESMNKAINALFNLYIEETKHTDLPEFLVSFEQNLYDATLRYSDDKEIKFLKQYKEDEIKNYNDYNGFMLMPNEKHDKFLIIINIRQINQENYGFVNTFIHEATHMFDFYKYMKMYNIKTMLECQNTKDFYLLQFWSEFHARYYGYKYLRKVFDVSKEELLKTVKNEEMTMHMNNLEESILNYDKYGEKVLIELCWQYGRFVNYEQYGFNPIEDSRFPKDSIILLFGYEAMELYHVFKRTLSFEDFVLNIEQIDFLLKRINLNHKRYYYEKYGC